MDIDAYISLCKQRLSQIEGILQQMEKDGIDPNVPVWDVLKEKYLFWTSRIEACSQIDPANWYVFMGDDYFWN